MKKNREMGLLLPALFWGWLAGGLCGSLFIWDVFYNVLNIAIENAADPVQGVNLYILIFTETI